MKTLKKLFLTSLCALTLFNAQAMHTDPTEPTTKIEAETAAAEVAPVSEADQLQAMLDEFKRIIPKLPATCLQVAISAIVWETGKEAGKDLWGVIKNSAKRAASSTAGASAYVMSQASNATTYATEYVRNGTLLAQVSDVIGSYADPESGESLYDTMVLAHPYVAEGAKVAALAAAVAVTYWLVNKAVQKYKKS